MRQACRSQGSTVGDVEPNLLEASPNLCDTETFDQIFGTVIYRGLFAIQARWKCARLRLLDWPSWRIFLDWPCQSEIDGSTEEDPERLPRMGF
jgi:hypothetical protein